MSPSKGRRPETRLMLYSEKWLFGSTRTELTHEERAIWIDLLALASFSGGMIEIHSREQLASQLCAPVDLLNRSIKKFRNTGKVKRIYKKREKKEIISILKWEHYQAEYLWQNPKKLDKNNRIEKIRKCDSDVSDKRKENKGKESIEEERGGKETDTEVTPLPKNLPFTVKDKICELKTEIRHQKQNMELQDTEEMKKFYLDNINSIQKEINELLKDCL